MKVTVTQKLNTRIGSASLNAPKGKVLQPGDEIEVAAVVKGVSFRGNDTWLKDAAGKFYWTGGTNYTATDMSYDMTKFPWHLKAIGLPELWEKLGNRGEGIKIGVIDSGIYKNHPEFIPAHITARGFLTGANDTDDTNGHGTACASLLVSRGDRMYGVCPDASLCMAKVYNQNSEIRVTAIANAIKWMVNEAGVSVISISLYVEAGNNNPVADIKILKDTIKMAHDKGVLVISTIGNHNIDFPMETYPASCPETVSVGAYNESNKIYLNTAINSKLDMLAPGEDIKLAGIGQAGLYKTDSGTSYSVAIVAGVIALLMKHHNCTSVAAYNHLKQMMHDTITSDINHKVFRKLSSNITTNLA